MESERILDDVGWNILSALQENARITWTELGQRVSMSPPAVAERVRRLEEAGIIEGYSARLSTERLGLPILAYMRITAPEERAYAELRKTLAETPEVLECHHLTGDDCLIAKVAVRSVKHLEEFLTRINRYGRTTTSIALSTVVPHRALGPDVLAERPGSVPVG